MLSDSLIDTLGTTGVIALILAVVFGVAAILNAWRRNRLHQPPPSQAGPIVISDPHTGRPIVNPTLHPDLQQSPPPAPPAVAPPAPSVPRPPPSSPPPLAPPARPPSVRETATAMPEPKEHLPKGAALFRQLDARGVDVEMTRAGKSDEYLWE